MIKNGNIILSQSMTKELGLYVINDQLESYPYCPKRFFHKFVDGSYPYETSDAMLGGLYFETLILGSSAKGQTGVEPARKRNGEKTADQVRIETLADMMTTYMSDKGIKYSSKHAQVALLAPYSKHIWLRGELDMFPIYIDNTPNIVDLKLTSDSSNEFFSFKVEKMGMSSSSCWGSYHNICKNQPLMYHFLARNYKKTPKDVMMRFAIDRNTDIYDEIYELEDNQFDDVDFKFFVAGKKDMTIKEFSYKYNNMRENLLHLLVQSSITEIRNCMASEFKPNKTTLCERCKLKDSCDSFLPKG